MSAWRLRQAVRHGKTFVLTKFEHLNVKRFTSLGGYLLNNAENNHSYFAGFTNFTDILSKKF